MASPWLAGARLDQALAQLAGLPRRRARALIAAGQVALDSLPTRTLSRPVATGSVIELYPPHPGAQPPPSLPLAPVVFADRWLVAAVKPSGVPATAPRVRAPGELTFAESLAMVLSSQAGRRVNPTLLHRLDRATSGLMLFALHPRASRELSRAWQTGGVRKRYLAVVAGTPGDEEVTLDFPVARDPLTSGRFAPAPGGRPARTLVRCLARATTSALVEARPLTGRTHQLRVHLAAAGWPVVGDHLYNGPRAPRLMLHAWRLELTHPITGQPLALTAPLPEDFSLLLEHFELAHGLPA